MFLAVMLAVVALFLGGLLGWQLTSNSAVKAPGSPPNGPMGTGTPASPAQMAVLHSAVAKTAGASGYTASVTISLEIGRSTVEAVKEEVDFQAPDRIFVSSTQSGHTVTATVIGNHCWIPGSSLGAGSCDTAGTSTDTDS